MEAFREARRREGRGIAALGPGRRATTTAGALLLAAMAAGVLSVVPVLEEPDYWAALPGREAELVTGGLFQALMVPAYAGFALALHPALRRVSPTLGLGFVAFRLVACGFHLLAVAMLALILDLGRGLDTGAGPETYEAIAETVRRGRDLVNHVVVIIATGLSDLLLLVVLLRWRLIPRWLAWWGLLGAMLTILASLLLFASAVEVVSVSYLALNGPLALHTVVLAGWLIVRGLEPGQPETAPPPSR